MKVFEIILIIIIVLLFLIKVIDVICNIIKFKHNAKNTLQVQYLSTTPSYSKYSKISSKTLSYNSPQRQTGDFYDYLVNPSSTDDNDKIENKILNIYGEDL